MLPKRGVIGADDVGDNVGEELVVMGAFPCELTSLLVFPGGYNWNCCNLSSSGEMLAPINGTSCMK